MLMAVEAQLAEMLHALKDYKPVVAEGEDGEPVEDR